MKRITTCLFPLVLLVLVSFDSPAQKRSYETTKLMNTPPSIDGVLDEPAWEAVEWAGDFIQISPYENKAPSQPTQFKILYDNDNLYLAVRMFDSSPDSIEKRLSRRDEFVGDQIEINIDSYHDLQTGFSFTVNAAGVKGDEAITNGTNWDATWDPIWYVKTRVDELGWTAEMRIPFTQLRFGKSDEYVWGMQITRYIFRHGERSGWQFISPNASGWVHNFGELTGIKDISPKKQFDLTPYVVAKIDNYQKDSNNPFADGRDFTPSAGLDGKIGLTNDLTLDFTINPDFGQVEADPSEVNLTTFETFFPEKRSFFIEGRNILSHQVLIGGSPMSQDNLFYSRRIGKQPGPPEVDADKDEYAKFPHNTTILGAFKVTGKTQKGLSIGIMESLTQKEVAQIDREGIRSEEVVEPMTNYFAARFQQDINNANTRFGGMITSTNRFLKEPYMTGEMISDAYTAGLNFRHEWKDKTYYIDVNAVYSQVQGSEQAIYKLQTEAPHYFQRPDANYLKADSTRTNLDGFGGTIYGGKNGNGKVSYLAWLTWRSPGLNLNDLGYMRRNDEIMQVFWLGYNQNEPFSIFRNANINVNQWTGFTFGPDWRYYGGNVNGHVQYKNYWCTGLGISRDGPSISTETLRGGPALVYDGYTSYWGHVGTDDRKKVRLVVSYSGGSRDGKNSINNSYNLGAYIQVSNALKFSIEPSFSTNMDQIEYVQTIDDMEPERYIRGKIEQTTSAVTFRFTYNISPDFTIQYYAMPFISAGNYNEFKYISDPKASSYSERYISYSDNQITEQYSDDNSLTYLIDENIDGFTDYKFDDPNFNIMDFNSNLVLRWEYRPGSILYLVWTQNRNKYNNEGSYSFLDESEELFNNTYPYDIFLVKLSFRIGL